MSQEYIFVFSGSKEYFLNSLDRFNHSSYSSGTFYYINDYMVKLIEDDIHFGVARGGHSGGYWYIPTFTDHGDRIEFCGTIRYIRPDDNLSSVKKAIDSIGEFLLLILILPIVLVIRLYMFIKWLVRKLCNRPKPKEKTNADRLPDLMENYSGCISK